MNKNVSIWRGNDTPPTQFHLWQKGDKLYHSSDLGWEENKIDLASIEKDGLMSKEDKKRLDNLVYDGLDNIIYDGLDSEDDSKALSAKQGNILLNKIQELNLSVYKPKGSVNSFEELPVQDLRIGDVYNIVNQFYIEGKKYPAGTNVVWIGSKWDSLGGTVDFSDYSTTEQVEVLYSELNSKLSEYQNNTNQLIEEKSQEATAALAAEVARASKQESNLSTSISDLNQSLITESSRATAAEEALRTSKVDKVEGKSLVSDDQIVKLTNLDNQDDITSNIADAKKAGTDAQFSLDSHTSNTSNPHNVTKNQIGLGNVDNTSDLNKPVSTATQTELNKKVDKIEGKGLSTEDYTTTDKTKLAGIANGAQVNSITGVKGGAEESYRTGNVNITAINLGLGNVDNTSDADKPISTATQTALNNKVDKVTGYGLSKNDFTDILKNKLDGIAEGAQVNSITGVKGSSEETYRTGNVSISASNIGLGNVNNTSDADKPISTAQQAALDEKVDKVAGKDLSTNDYTTDERNKLAGIAAGAQVNVIESVKINGTVQAISSKEVDISIPTKLSQLTNDVYEIATSAEITAILN